MQKIVILIIFIFLIVACNPSAEEETKIPPSTPAPATVEADKAEQPPTATPTEAPESEESDTSEESETEQTLNTVQPEPTLEEEEEATADEISGNFGDWMPPRTAVEWLSNPVRGAVIEIGYGGPDEYNDPPYPSVESLQQLRDLGAQVVALEFQYVWTIEPPYQADEDQFDRVTAALDNVAAAGLYAVVAVRNGPGRNGMMPDVADEDVITTLYVDETAQAAYQDMLDDVVSRFKDRPEIIAWEPIVEPMLDTFLTHEKDAPYPQAAALWNEFAPELIAAIREADPKRPILIEPVNWGGLDGFILLDRFDDDNIIYSLHTYEPFAYTHQEIPPYAAYPGEFDNEYFDQAMLETLLAPVDAFQAQHNVPIVVGEWGGIRWQPGLDQYIADQLSLFEARGWSWLWYAWDDEEWDELGFELHMGPDRDSPAYDPETPAFRPIMDVWQAAPQTASISPSSPTFSFAYQSRPDGAMRLIDPPLGSSDQNPAFSPAGAHMIFTRFENGYNQGPAGIYLLDLSSGEVNLLTAAPDSDSVNLPGSSWNATTKRITFASDREDSDEIWTMAADGSDLSRVTNQIAAGYALESSFSLDGQWIVFEFDNQGSDDEQQGSIWKIRADGTEPTPLLDGPNSGTDNRQPNWSPTGQRILFQGREPGIDDWNLYTMAPDGSDIQPVTTSSSSDTDASWSPDGQWIVYSSDYGELATPNVFIIPAKGGDPVRITHDESRGEGAASWSPDGQWIAFESYPSLEDEETPATVWLIAAPANEQTEATLPPSSERSPSKARLADVSNWFYMLDVDLEAEMVEQMVTSKYDMVVLDFISFEANNTDYPMAEVVDRLHKTSHPKLVMAYIDIGQAEDFRTYWQPGWGIGNPEWIVALDPDGWAGNYPVAYWEDGWRDIWLGPDGVLQAILEAGFDGIYLDWVEAYSDENVLAVAESDGVDARQEMIWWVGDMAEFTRAQRPDFIVIGQNAAELAASDEYVNIIDAIAQEQVWFDGAADNDPAGDCPLPGTEAEVETETYIASLSEPCRVMYEEFPDSTLHVSSEAYLRDLTLAQSKGVIIFTVDYALKPDNVVWVYETSRAQGFVPFASNRALNQYLTPALETESNIVEDDWWQPAVDTTWQWELTDQPIDPSFEVDMYDIEMFDSDAATVAELHTQGRKVVCYLSAGSWEDWRPDAADFPASIIGNDYGGWPGEKWLDIRQIDLLGPIMLARLDECQAKGFDGIEPDNIDGYTNDTGFPLTYQDQLDYNIWLANEAHARGLSIGLKNDSDQVADLLPYFDWALTEDCFAQEWCEEMLPFIETGKPVFAAEYTDTGITTDQFCPQAQEMNISVILKNRELDAWLELCN